MTDAPNGWSKEAREAVQNALREAGLLSLWEMTAAPEAARTILAALAPFVAAREAAAAQAMRDACAAIVDAHAAAAKRCSEEGDVIYRIRAEFLANSYAITQAADDVRVTPLPDTSALAAALAEARREGMREAARMHTKLADDLDMIGRVHSKEGFPGYAEQDHAAAKRHREHAAAILAAAKEDKA
jgi:hypothetical protein